MAPNRTLPALLALCTAALASSSRAQTSYEFSRIASTGRHAPVPSLTGTANNPVINSAGQIAFESDGGVFLRTSSKTKIIAAIGVGAPGGGQFLSASSPSLNSQGHLAFVGAAQAPSSSGIFLFAAGKYSLLAAEGQNTSAGPVFGLNSPSLNANDEVAFLSFNGVFTAQNGAINKIAATGDPSPEGDIFSSFSFPQINSSGQVVFTASLLSGTTGIYLAGNGSITKVVNSNDFSPLGGTFAFFFEPASINDSGQIAFNALVNGPTSASGIYIYNAGQLTVKVPAFTTLSNGTQLAFPDFPSINSGGEVAFRCQLVSDIQSGVYVTSAGNIIPVVTPGQVAPDGGLFADGFSPVLSDAGQVVFDAREQAENNAVFLFSNSQLTRIAGPGDLINQLARFTFPFSFGGINDAGTVLFEDVTFPGGTGLFTGAIETDVLPAALTNERLPDGGSLFNFFENVAINNNNQVVFDTGGFAGSDDLILESGGQLQIIARGAFPAGDPAPDGGTFFNFGQASINNLGQVAFAGSTIGGAGQGLYLYSGGQLSAMLDDFSPTPPGITLGTFSLPSLNDNGQVAFFDQPFPQPNAFLFLSAANLALIAQDGDPAPGGGNFSLPFPDPSFGPSLNVQGQIVFSADLSTGGEAVYLYSQGTLTRVVGPGDTAPDGSSFLSASSAAINAKGQITFQGITSTGDFGVYLYNNGTVTTVAHAGTLIGGHNTLVAAFLPSINSSGQISFTGALADGTSAVVIASPQSGQSASSSTQTSVGPSTNDVVVSPERMRSLLDRATHRGVFANPDVRTPKNRSPLSKQP